MRNSDPHPDSGAAEPLTLEQNIVYRALGQPGQCRGALGELLQSALFVCRTQLGDDAERRYQIGDVHFPPLDLRGSCAFCSGSPNAARAEHWYCSGGASAHPAGRIQFRVDPPNIAVGSPVDEIELAV